MELINSILSWIMKKRIHQIELFLKYPHDVQFEVLKELINKTTGTVYGKKYEFRTASNYATYKERTPLITYEDIFPFIERVIKGEPNVLWPGEVRWFAKSSGTTNARSKFIPVTNEALHDCHFKGGKDLLSIYFNNYPTAKMFSGKGLVIGGSHQVNQLNRNSKTYYGDVSAILLKNLPWWAQLVKTPKLDVALMDEWETKINKMAEVTSEENVTNISGVPTWTIVLLEKIMAHKNISNILEVWPNLEVFFHGAVAFTPYRELFRKIVPSPKMRYMETYNASEGFFGIQDQTDEQDLLLMLDYGIFYEFIPGSELDRSDPKTLTLADVELNKNYAMVITTNAGLWRYKIGDTVRFTSLDPYRIRITGRTRHFINAFGEEVIVEDAERALADACRKTNATIDNFTAGPIYFGDGNRGGHEWIIEFEECPDDLDRFTRLLDEKLREINSDYDAKRHRDLALAPPTIHVAVSGTFYRWMKSRQKLGGQHKVPRLSNTREFIDDLLKKTRSV